MSRVVKFAAGFVGSLVVLVGTVSAGVWLTGRQTAHVALPPDTASPRTVVAAYLRALDAHDCRTAVQLRSPRGDSRQLGRLWCRDVQHLRHVRIEQRAEIQGRMSGVAVSFDLAWRPFHDDGSMDEGPTQWGYELLRASRSAPWRITDEGGP